MEEPEKDGQGNSTGTCHGPHSRFQSMEGKHDQDQIVSHAENHLFFIRVEAL